MTDKTAAKAIRWLESLDLLESSFLRDSSGSAPGARPTEPLQEFLQNQPGGEDELRAAQSAAELGNLWRVRGYVAAQGE